MLWKVERALTLVRDYCIMIESIAEDRLAKKKTFSLKIQTNPRTGKSSSRNLAYSEEVWGAVTRGFSQGAKSKISDVAKLQRIVGAAKAFEKVTRRTGSSNATSTEVNLQEEERAHLGDADDSEEE